MKNYIHGLGVVLLAGLVSSACRAQEPNADAQEGAASKKAVVPWVFISPAAKASWKFSFSENAPLGTLLVAPTATYTSELGYGFESGSEVVANSGFTTSASRLYCWLRFPKVIIA